jgi:hypothetical protein
MEEVSLMRSFNILFHLVRADFLERSRRYGFLITLGLALYLGYAVNADQIVFSLGSYRGIYNSAWVGALMTIVIVFFLGLIGFYLVNNTISRDESTGVGQIIAATPVSKFSYLLGKWFSNFLVLGIMVIILAIAGIFFQLIRPETATFDLQAFVMPLINIALPLMALVAAIAVLFESIPFFRGGLGNVLYFFLIMFIFIGSVDLLEGHPDIYDPTGFNMLMKSMHEAAKNTYPEFSGGFLINIGSRGAKQVFLWPGIDWTPLLIGQRSIWYGIGLLIVIFSTLIFNRFDKTRTKKTRNKKQKKQISDNVLIDNNPKPVHYSKLSNEDYVFSFLEMLRIELAILIKGQKWWWYAIAIVFIILQITSPIENVKTIILPLTFIWPILIWSKIGCRDHQYRTKEIVLSTPKIMQRQFAVTWVAGVVITFLISSGAFVKFLTLQDTIGVKALLIGILFIPSFALTCGILSGANKSFEILYVLIWYLGPLNQLAIMDFLGLSSDSHSIMFLIISGLLILLSFFIRKKQANA